MTAPHIWMRHEVRSTERRAPLVPADAARLTEAGFRLTVERSPQRAFGIDEYAAEGAEIAPAGSWVSDAPDDAFVLGLKELPDGPAQLRHRHIYFAHAYKGQDGAAELLGRFTGGGGTLLDIEYLVDDTGRRVVAFGYWAGYVGAALAVLQSRGRLEPPLTPYERPLLDAALDATRPPPGSDAETALVIGAAGRSGQGALDALAAAGIKGTAWDKDETLSLDREALLAHRLLVNCVLATSPIPPFVRAEDLEAPHALAVIGDVTCDVTSALNVIPVNTRVTSWDDPVARVSGDVDVIAIDNLPSLLPAEASITFSADLLPQLLQLDAGLTAPVWSRAADLFATKVVE